MCSCNANLLHMPTFRDLLFKCQHLRFKVNNPSTSQSKVDTQQRIPSLRIPSEFSFCLEVCIICWCLQTLCILDFPQTEKEARIYDHLNYCQNVRRGREALGGGRDTIKCLREERSSLVQAQKTIWRTVSTQKGKRFNSGVWSNEFKDEGKPEN